MNFLRVFLITIICLAFGDRSAVGNSYDFADLPPLTLEDACKYSKLIVVARYQDFELAQEKNLPIYQGISARYEVNRILKGDFDRSSRLKAEYELSHEFNFVPQKNWKFSKSLMPKKNSKWILFLHYPFPSGKYCTYRGSFGRMPYDDSLESEIIQILK